MIEDSDGLSTIPESRATVTITVTCTRPDIIATDDEATVPAGDRYVDIPVTDNDEDPEDDPLFISMVGVPVYGTATKRPGGKIRYRPGPEAEEECNKIAGDLVDTFTYEVTDENDKQTDTATVTVYIECERATPKAFDDEDETTEDQPVTVTPSVLRNDLDPGKFT